MNTSGRVRIGHRAPDFHCEAVIKGLIEEVTLSTYITPTSPSWLLLLFIPAAFSFVCPTEVLAFQNCLDEFKDRNCNVVFVSVDTKHSLWHWQNVPRQYGGLGQIDIALLSDASHKMSRDYGVLIEEEGVCLRGMFILDGEGVVQQVTLNNLTVGRSVLEALRLLEAFQAVAKHGVLCPIDWKPNTHGLDAMDTISNTLTDSYDERFANLQKEFGDTVVTDLDAKHKHEVNEQFASSRDSIDSSSKDNGSLAEERSDSEEVGSTNTTVIGSGNAENESKEKSNEYSPREHGETSGKKQRDIRRKVTPKDSSTTASPIASPSTDYDCIPRNPTTSQHSSPAPAPASTMPMPTPPPSAIQCPPPARIPGGISGTARHSRGHTTASQAPHPHKPNTYSSRRGSHIVLEFADPTSSPQPTPTPSTASTSSTSSPGPSHTPSSSTTLPLPFLPPRPPLAVANSASLLHPPCSSSRGCGVRQDTPPPPYGRASASRNASLSKGAVQGMPGQTRLQATFEAIKKMSAGLGSPRVDLSPRRGGGNGNGSGSGNENGNGAGYFDVVVVVEGVEG